MLSCTLALMETMAERIARALQAKNNGNQSEMARYVGVSPQAVQKWIAGSSEPRGKNLRKAAEFLGVTPAELQYATEAEKVSGMPAGAFPVNQSRYRQIPVYGKAMGGFPERIWDEDGHYPAGFSDQFAEVASSDPNAFLVPVEGVSMIPRFNPGEFAMVEPGTEPELEDDVLVRLGDGRTMIKKLLSRRGVVRLGSYNSPEIISSPPEHIVWMYYVAHPVPARKIKQRM